MFSYAATLFGIFLKRLESKTPSTKTSTPQVDPEAAFTLARNAKLNELKILANLLILASYEGSLAKEILAIAGESLSLNSFSRLIYAMSPTSPPEPALLKGILRVLRLAEVVKEKEALTSQGQHDSYDLRGDKALQLWSKLSAHMHLYDFESMQEFLLIAFSESVLSRAQTVAKEEGAEASRNDILA